MTVPPDFTFLTPWRELRDSEPGLNRKKLLSELRKEVPVGHVLHGVKANAIATRADQDDVLFELEGGEKVLAVVHMTWKVETDPQWPRTRLFSSWEEWVREAMRPDHEDYIFPEKADYDS